MSKTNLFLLKGFNTERKEEIVVSFHLLLCFLFNRKTPAYYWRLASWCNDDKHLILSELWINIFTYFDSNLALKISQHTIVHSRKLQDIILGLLCGASLSQRYPRPFKHRPFSCENGDRVMGKDDRNLSVQADYLLSYFILSTKFDGLKCTPRYPSHFCSSTPRFLACVNLSIANHTGIEELVWHENLEQLDPGRVRASWTQGEIGMKLWWDQFPKQKWG